MSKAKEGDTVKVHYTGKLNDGTVFDSSMDRAPLQFTIGKSEIIPGFEGLVRGLAIGERKSAEIPAEDAYGPHRPEMVMQVDRDQFPEDLQPEVGQQLEMVRDGGDPVRITVTEVNESTVVIDANHPLAGKTLTFEVELVEIA